jgi:mono/diheme cytochrome c family protein
MWMGVGVAIASILLSVKILRKQYGIIHKATSFSLLMLVVVTGHLGGSLTHGSDYLTASFSAKEDTVAAFKPIANIQEAEVYDDVIQPLFQSKCYSCHNAQKQKGGLRMDDPQLLMKGGKDGKVILTGNAAESDLVKRLMLPREDEHHMPPKQKPQLNERQIALIHWWIENGADFNKKVKDLQQPEKIKPALLALQSDHTERKAPSNIPTGEVEKADDKAIATLKNLGVVVIPVAKGSNYLMANFVTAPATTDEHIKLLLPLKKQLVWLKLGDTRITDKAAPLIGQCTNLTLLHLNNTNITDRGVESLQSLNNLQLLNLVNTKVTDAGFQQLASLKSLQSVYLYKTNVTADGLARLKNILPNTTIDTGGYTIPFLSTDTAVAKQKPY